MMKGKGKVGASTSSVENGKINNAEGSPRASILSRPDKVSKKVCIYRVPKPIRNSKSEFYDPLVVSFGPFHYKMNPEMDEHKIEAVHRTSEKLPMGIPDLIEYIKTFDDQIRECYAEPIKLNRDELSLVFTMDACFILEILKGPTRTGDQRDQIAEDQFSLVFQNYRRKNSMYLGIMLDIMKMENQIPLFLLKSLLEKEFKDSAVDHLCHMLFASGVFNGFPFRFPSSSSYSEDEIFKKLRNHVNTEPAHLLDLYRMLIEDLLTHSTESACVVEVAEVSRSTHSSNDRRESASLLEHGDTSEVSRSTHSSDDRRCIPSAELLKTAGIKFEQGQVNFTKRRFGESTLSLPQIIVEDRTVTMLRNVMAYEECQKCSWDPKKTAISQFLLLLDYLIDSAEDVSVLRKAGIISGLACSDEDIARRFNSINQGTIVGNYNGFDEVMKKATEHYESHWNVLISQFIEEHFSKPWYVVSIGAGILFLFLTFLQTVYTVLGYYNIH